MSSWPTVQLGDVCQFRYGKALAAAQRDGGEYAVFGSNGPVGSHSKTLSKGPTIVIGRKGSFGEVAYSPESCWPIDTTYFIDATCTEADLKWLSYRLRSLGLTNLNRAAAVPGLNREDAYRQRLLLPPIDEQQRIAAILDQADNLRAQRFESLALLGGLTPSLFGDLFGSETFPTHPLASLCDVASGITKGRKLRGEATRAVPYLAVSNVQAGHLKLDMVKEIEATEAELDRYALKDGDLVLTEGGDPDKLGRGAVWRSQLPLCIHQNHIFRVRIAPGAELLPDYLSAYMSARTARTYFLRAAKQTTGIASINMTQLRGLPVALPELALQKEFVARVDAVAHHAGSVRAASRRESQLFHSLQSRAFSGQL